MKKLVLCFASVVFVTTLSSFTSITDKSEDFYQQVSCRWRTTYYLSNGDVAHTEWTYGNCNRTESGVLTPIK